MAIAFAKWSVWVKKCKSQKNIENESRSTINLFHAKKKSSKKQVTFEKLDHFENWQKSVLSKAIAFAKWSVWVKNVNGKKIQEWTLEAR